MKILVTGANGFIAQNLIVHLKEKKHEVLSFARQDDPNLLSHFMSQADFIFHLAGVNRPENTAEYGQNVDLTKEVCSHLRRLGKRLPLVFSSSTQANLDVPYGMSKKMAENELLKLFEPSEVPLYIFRLPHVFGKWCRPNYNSAITTFCYNTANNLPIAIHNTDAVLHCVYIDDVVKRFIHCLTETEADDNAVDYFRLTPTLPDLSAKSRDTKKFSDPADKPRDDRFFYVNPVYQSTVGEIASTIQSFPKLRGNLLTERVGAGLVRALYSTYLSYLPVESFYYSLPIHEDSRGVFVEMLKTPDCGQFSYFTAKPGITRGGHYHHTKAEKFLVIQGEALFRFRHIISNEYHEVSMAASKPQVVESIPGWSHNITNVGQTDLIVLLWANEVFDVEQPDTIGHEV